MPDAPLTILCTGDLHLGRHPTRIPDDLDAPEFSPTTIWPNIADVAVDRGVDAVVLTGDLIDRENRYYEAYGAFEAGVGRLDEAGIPVLGVAGNHDFDTFPQLVDTLDAENLSCLGEAGTWESRTVETAGNKQVQFVGWSFPERYYHESPVGSFEADLDSEVPTVGLLHADLDAAESAYAPARRSTLQEVDVDVWALGHIHNPGVRTEPDPHIFYPGSPQPLDPGERGTHGPWLLRLDDAGVADLEQVPLATVRYDRFAVAVDGIADPKDVPGAVQEYLEERVRHEQDAGPLEVLVARLVLQGRTEAHAELAAEREALARDLALNLDGLPVRIDEVTVDTRPAVELEGLAGGETPVSRLAELLLAIEDDELDERDEPLVRGALKMLREAHGASAYRELRSERESFPVPEREDAVELLEREARLVLDTLSRQTEDAR